MLTVLVAEASCTHVHNKLNLIPQRLKEKLASSKRIMIIVQYSLLLHHCLDYLGSQQFCIIICSTLYDYVHVLYVYTCIVSMCEVVHGSMGTSCVALYGRAHSQVYIPGGELSG